MLDKSSLNVFKNKGPMQKELYAGAIIFYVGRKGREYLLLEDTYGKWALPKGLLTRDEDFLEAVKRVVLEETGLSDLEFTTGFKETYQSMLTFEAELVLKSVTWYIVRVKTREVKISRDYQSHKWCSLRVALRSIEARPIQEILKKADGFLDIPRLL